MKRAVIFFCLSLICIPAWGREIGGIRIEQEAGVELSRIEGTWTDPSGEVLSIIRTALNSGRFQYQLRYGQHNNGQIGIVQPSSANWHSDMINVYINGERIDLLSENNEKMVVEEGAIGKAKFSWETDVTKLALNFYLFALDDKLFMEVLVEPKQDIDSLEIRLVNYTSGFIHDRRHVLYTGRRLVDESGWNSIDLPGENWLLLTDDNLDYAENDKSQGPSAVAYLPDDFTKARVALGGYGCSVRFSCKPEAGRFIFALWEFPEKGNKEVAQTMEERIEDAVEKMTKILGGI